jgi:hypothetical protein
MKIPHHLTTLLLVLVLGTILPACQKCETCSYTVQVASGNKTTEAFREICGRKYQRDIDRGACETIAAQYG